MKKTSLYLDPELDAALTRRAEEEGLSKAEFVRRTLAAAMDRPRRAKPSVGVFRSGLGDVSANVDQYLADTGFGETPPDRRR